MKKNKIEILAPVGKMDMLYPAIRRGANAIYIGLGQLNARQSAQDFSKEEFEEIIRYAHSHGVKVHVALNVLVFENEFELVLETLKTLADMGADAVIVQDFGVAKIIKEAVPTLPIHASTQMSINSVNGAIMAEKLGFKRIILARELTKTEIKDITDAVEIETEVFVHGAHCMSVSGQCTMSSMIGGRSGNRGRCAQPCRLPFSKGRETQFNLSLKDMSIVENIKELEDMGVASIKIEGRMKRPEYVAAAVTACVSARDQKPSFHYDYDILKKVFSRSGFTDGFYNNKIDSTMYGTREKNDSKFTSEVLPKLTSSYRNETPLIEVSMRYTQKKDEPISLIITDETGITGEALGAVPEIPNHRALAKDRIFENLAKLGSTPYFIKEERIGFDTDESLTLPISAINALRRDALEDLKITQF